MIFLPILLTAPALAAAPVKTDSVCIIGAGASGLMTARQLRAKGYVGVQIFEKNSWIGGKAYNYIDPNGFKHPMGPEGGWDGYYKTMSLLKEFGVPYTNLTNDFKTVVFEAKTGAKVVNPAPSDLAAFQAAYAKYLTLRAGYVQYLGNGYSGTLPAALSIPFLDFINKNGLQALLPSLYASIVSYGYGSLSVMPTLYGLRTLTPGKLKASVDRTTIFNTDYQLLLQKMAAALQTGTNPVSIRLNTNIVSINRQGNYVALNIQSSVAEAVICNWVVLAFSPASQLLKIIDMDSTETKLFDNVIHKQYASHVSYMPPAIERNAIYFGTLGYDAAKNPPLFPAEPKGDMRPIAMKKFNPKSDYAVIFNWHSADNGTSESTFAQQLLPYLKGPLTGNYPASISLTVKHQYSPQVTDNAIKAGFFNSLKAMQGYRRTYYISALTSFELMEDVFQGAIDFVNMYF